MVWALNATNPGPWTGCYPAAVTDTVVQHGWRMTYAAPGSSTWLDLGPVWDVTVDLDLFRSPAAILRAKIPGGAPLIGSWVRLYTSYTLAGVTTEGTLFFGMLTATAQVRPFGGGSPSQWSEITAESAETCWDFPSNATHNISNSYTRVAETQLSNVTWQAPNTLRLWEHPDLNTPTSPQLTAFRAMGVTPGDNVDTFVHAMAESLGQRVTGDYRRRYPGSEKAAYAITPRQPDSNTTLNLTGRVTDWRRSTSIDQQASAVDITAQWISAGDNKQSRRIYGGGGTDFTRQRSISIPMRPTGGSLGASDPTALAYLTSIQSYVTRITFTARAIWWLDLLMHVTATADKGPRPVVALTFHVDAGLMAVTLADPNV